MQKINQKGNTTLAVIVAIIITAIVVGGGMYFWQKASNQKGERGLEQQSISEINKKPATDNVDANVKNISSQTTTKDVKWKVYKSADYKYAIKHPVSWIKKTNKPMLLGDNFYKGNDRVLNIVVDYKTKVGDKTLKEFALQVPAPKDKTIISDVKQYQIGNFKGYKRLVECSDPIDKRVEYIIANDKFVYRFIIPSGVEAPEIPAVLKSFKFVD